MGWESRASPRNPHHFSALSWPPLPAAAPVPAPFPEGQPRAGGGYGGMIFPGMLAGPVRCLGTARYGAVSRPRRLFAQLLRSEQV